MCCYGCFYCNMYCIMSIVEIGLHLLMVQNHVFIVDTDHINEGVRSSDMVSGPIVQIVTFA